MPGQPLAHIHAALLVPVDDLHGHAHLQKLLGKIIAHLAGAHDHDGGRLAPEHAQMAEELLQLGGRRGQVDLVAGFQFKVAGGDDGLPLAGHGADQHPHPQVPVEVGKTHAVQLAALPDAILHQLHAALGKGLQLDGIGKTQYAGDLKRAVAFSG